MSSYQAPGAGAEAALRRAPYADNPAVGTRGQRTQERILDAALQVFGEHGYERSTIDKIGQVAGCSRVSIYQYFSGKDDVFRHLAGQVARQLRASVETLGPVTADGAGWDALRAWVARYGDIYERYEPVFRAFGVAAESDAALAGGSVRTGERNVARFRATLAKPAVPPRHVDAAVRLLTTTVTRCLDSAAILRAALPEAYERDRVEDAVTDVLHRSLFGIVDGVDARGPGERPPSLPIGPGLLAVFDRALEFEREASQPGRRALASLLEVGHEVIVQRGYHGTRVDDVVAAAGVSHGAFYRYFENKDDLVGVVAARALTAVSTALAAIPVGGDRPAVRRWLRRYNTVHAANGSMIRVWVEAGGDPLRDDRAAVFDWGRRRMARFLEGRRFGDAAMDGLVLLAFVEAFGAVPRAAPEVDAAVHIVERGFLGR